MIDPLTIALKIWVMVIFAYCKLKYDKRMAR